ncbi:alpha/beta hydrolase [Burkholderiaceae bacterium FT117]|uniref:alpha/beta hydrolase n=1 Tax=Zeimonas sediminis TaxID=2944268 RepID=UPI002342D88B|nr:alpha/beta hydrolase [Zeimonas sediminis]MCM5569866.1 alpha/beta hydrolase [Zeimonas sediminis]
MMQTIKFALAAFVIALGAGAAYQHLGQAADRAAAPPPGRLVAVGDGRMHLLCEGHGAPTVVLEAGATGFAQTWAWVQRELAAHGRVCAYDRSGLGWSDDLGTDHDGVTAALNLRTLLARAGERGPFVMAGHSLGGPLVQIFASRYPEDVAAIALVDPSHPDQLDRFPPDARRQQERFADLLGAAALASHVGLTRATNALGRNALGLPEADYRAARMFASSATHLATSRKEMLAWHVTMEAAQRAADGDAKPLLVISAGRAMAGMPDGFLPVVHALHRELTATHGAGRHVVIDGADHFSLLMNRSHAQRVGREIAGLRVRATVPGPSEPAMARPQAALAPSDG